MFTSNTLGVFKENEGESNMYKLQKSIGVVLILQNFCLQQKLGFSGFFT